MRILTNQGYVEAVGVFFELTAEQLELVKKDSLYFMNKELIKGFSQSRGNNAHFIGACNNGAGSLINKYITAMLKDYKTVSWWDKDMKDFVIKRSQ